MKEVCEIRWIFQWFQKANMRALGPRVSQLYTAAILYMKSQNSITIIFTIKSLSKKILILHTRIFSRSLEVGGLKK